MCSWAMLQWGRDVSIPEIRHSRKQCPGDRMLQWGRDVSIPEISMFRVVLTNPATGFNGAGMFPSQKLARGTGESLSLSGFNGAGMFPSQKLPAYCPSSCFPARLQWGRDVSIPEIGVDRRRGVRLHRASMGPGCFHPRNEIVARDAAKINYASMGPGCFHPRNDVDAVRRYCHGRRFNGAGMFPSQK